MASPQLLLSLNKARRNLSEHISANCIYYNSLQQSGGTCNAEIQI